MTTEQNTPQEEVSAPDVSAEEIAEQVLTPQAPPVEERKEPEPAKVLDFDTFERGMERIERTLQGRSVNAFGEFRKELTQKIERELAPIREFTTRLEQAQIEQLDPEQQAEYWKRKATQQPTAPKSEPEPEPQGQYTSQEQQEITASVRGMLEFSGLDIAIDDEELWKGFKQGDSPARIKQIAAQNIRRLQGAQRPAPVAEKPEPKPAPSTSGAPRRSASTLTTRSEVWQAFSDRVIKDSVELNKALASIKTTGRYTL